MEGGGKRNPVLTRRAGTTVAILFAAAGLSAPTIAFAQESEPSGWRLREVAAMHASGFRADVRPWYVWHYRGDREAVLAAARGLAAGALAHP